MMENNDISDKDLKIKEAEEYSWRVQTLTKFARDIHSLNEVMLLLFSSKLLGRDDNITNASHYADIMRGLNILLLDCAENINNKEIK